MFSLYEIWWFRDVGSLRGTSNFGICDPGIHGRVYGASKQTKGLDDSSAFVCFDQHGR